MIVTKRQLKAAVEALRGVKPDTEFELTEITPEAIRLKGPSPKASRYIVADRGGKISEVGLFDPSTGERPGRR